MIFASTPPINDDPFHDFKLRPEFDRPRAHEANSVLIAFREYADRNDVAREDAVDFWLFAIEAFELFGGYERWETTPHMFHSLTTATAAEIDHAKHVLNRLTVKS